VNRAQGSDLAGLGTKAVLEGDEYIINGSKIWTSYADQADWIFCLVRTDFEAPKHSGISFILFDMNSPGVTTKPIKLISGNSVFCETFFDNVRVPAGNVVGRLNDGWTIAKRLLQHERTMISGFGLSSGRNNRGGLADNLEQTAMKYRGDSGKLSDAACATRSRNSRSTARHLPLLRSGRRRKPNKAKGQMPLHPC
jgi:acyl-CoA dehydrogenase